MSPRDVHSLTFYREELLRAQRALFTVGTVKGVKNMQERIIFLRDKISQLEQVN